MTSFARGSVGFDDVETVGPGSLLFGPKVVLACLSASSWFSARCFVGEDKARRERGAGKQEIRLALK